MRVGEITAWLRSDHATGDGDCQLPLLGLEVSALDAAAPWPRPRGAGRGLSGWYWSSTTGSHLRYPTQQVLARLLLADQDPAVTGIYPRPLRLQVAAEGGEAVEYVPELVLVDHDGAPRAVEIAAPDPTSGGGSGREVNWAALLAGAGWGHEVFTGADRSRRSTGGRAGWRTRTRRGRTRRR